MKFSAVKSKWFYFLLLINLIFGAALAKTLLQYRQFISSEEQSEKERVVSLTQKAARDLGEIVERVENQAQELADTFSAQQNLSPEAIEKQLSGALDNNTDLLGSSVFYGPYAYSKDKYLFGPYLHIKDDGGREIVDVGSLYDYTQEDKKSNFFHLPFNENKAMWTVPFWGEASKSLLLTYSVPFYIDAKKESPSGVIVLSISLDKIKEIVGSLDVGTNGLSALTTKEGNYIYYHIYEYVTKMRNLTDVAKEEDDKDRMFIAQQARELKGGILDHISVSTRKPAWLVWEPVPFSGWSLQVTFLKEDMIGDPNIIKRKKIIILVSVILLSVALCALILQAAPADAHKKQGIFSAVSSLLLLSGIGFIWGIYLNNYKLVRNDIVEVTSYGKREKIKQEYHVLCRDNNLERPRYLPTGIYIETIKFINQNEIELTGYVWQKYEKGEHDDLSRGIAFTRVSSSKITEVLKQQQGNQEVVRWSFSASIRQNIDYSRYPIDHGRISLKIVHKDLNHNVVLVPDFESYHRIVPILKPGVDKKAFVPGWIITGSRFELQKKDNDTNFGVKETISKQNFPVLAFSVSIKRLFVNAFISNLVPMIVVYVMLFAFISIKADVKSLLSMCSGMFFAIVVAHVNARKDIAVYEIFYLEYFYIVTYLILIFLVSASIKFHHKDEIYEKKLLSTARLLYWPVVSSSFFVITAILFYR
uniref:PDC sensor domain-containing protein n=1 Tax=Candidatus Electronema sp. TaxID=2698783 RepID=UPI004056AF5A